MLTNFNFVVNGRHYLSSKGIIMSDKIMDLLMRDMRVLNGEIEQPSFQFDEIEESTFLITDEKLHEFIAKSFTVTLFDYGFDFHLVAVGCGIPFNFCRIIKQNDNSETNKKLRKIHSNLFGCDDYRTHEDDFKKLSDFVMNEIQPDVIEAIEEHYA